MNSSVRCMSLGVSQYQSTHTVRDVLQNTDTQAWTLAVHKSMAAHSVLQPSFSIQPSWVQFSNPDPIHDRHSIRSLPQLAAHFPLPPASFERLLSVPSEMRKNPPTPSRNGDVRFAGEASFCLFVLMVEPGGQHQNPLMVQSRHTRAKKTGWLSRLQSILENPAGSRAFGSTETFRFL